MKRKKKLIIHIYSTLNVLGLTDWSTEIKGSNQISPCLMQTTSLRQSDNTQQLTIFTCPSNSTTIYTCTAYPVDNNPFSYSIDWWNLQAVNWAGLESNPFHNKSIQEVNWNYNINSNFPYCILWENWNSNHFFFLNWRNWPQPWPPLIHCPICKPPNQIGSGRPIQVKQWTTCLKQCNYVSNNK